jgi:HK97 gp10 family phage protein
MADGLVIVYNLLPEVKGALRAAVAKAVAQTASYLKDVVASTAPVKSGFLASSVYMVTKKQSTYGQGVASPSGDSYLLPEVEAPPNNLSAVVAVAASYGVFVELGTSRMAAQPFLTPAVPAAQERLSAQIEHLENEIHRIMGEGVAADEGSY